MIENKGNIRGNLRKSQIILGAGPGSIVDLKKGSVILSGISKWENYDKDKDILHSPKLERLLGVKYFVTPPHKKSIRFEDGTEILQKDILAYQFPKWGYCPVCKKLGEVRDFIVTSDGKWKCTCNNKTPIIPSRFVIACEDGHIADFPYRYWVHQGNLNCKEELTISETGSSAGLESILIKCKCGAHRNLEGIFDPQKFKYQCCGDKPWLGENVKDLNCSKEVRVLQRSSSSVYYPVIASSIEVPQWNNRLTEKLEQMKNYINEDNKKVFAEAIAKDLNMPIEDVLDEMNKSIGWSGSMEDEYRALRREYQEENFNSKEEAVPELLKEYVNKIVLINKMTEVIAQVGFKRIDPNYDVTNEETYVSFKKEQPNWLPAFENKGEGIFIEFNEDKIKEWELRKNVQDRYSKIVQRADEGIFRSLRKPINPRTILIHTLAHALIKELTFECGYSASSIKERIYTTYDEGIDMSGVLLYTTSSDSDGSLGGLVAQGKTDKIEVIFRRMLDKMEWCSTDPLCIESELHGYKNANFAACHACTLLPETSCELRNILLDRASIRGRLDDLSLGFFGKFYENEEIE